MKIDPTTALIIVDVQNDFCPGGSLAVPKGDEVVPVLNQYIERFRQKKAVIFATRDWHPGNHISFKERGGPWPPHCVQGTPGAELHPQLKLPPAAQIISKASSPDRDAYSGFEGTGLEERLRRGGIKTVFVGGLATDYCVVSTALDAVKAGFTTFFLEDASRGVEVKPGDCEKAIARMREKGIEAVTLKQF